ncbi:MAG: ATP synthase F0 subunit B [Candidatus Acidiferrum sp.]|jgi:F-type H+-transporting ATPase subunit b
MRLNKRLFIGSGFLFVFFCAGLTAFAAAEGGSSAGENANEIFKWINFAIVAAVLIWLFAKKLPGWFRGNAETIRSAIAKATAAKEEAERQVREAEGKLARLEEEIAALRATAQREIGEEGERIRTMAQSDAKKVGIAAQAEIDAAERAARIELKALAASLAVDGAESLLAKQLTPAAQETLVDTFVKSLEGRPN